jgi:glutamine cyclotransferase
MKWTHVIPLFLILVVLYGCITKPATAPLTSPEITGLIATTTSPTQYTYQVINTYPHDRNASTQGLVFEDNILYEGTGLYGRSTLRKVDLKTGNILKIRELPSQFFGEGVTIYDNKIIQLTWRSGTGFVYDKDSFELAREFRYSHEGWGITYDGRYLIVSDGTALLRLLDTETFEEIRSIEIYDGDNPVSNLNELEFVKGQLYANIWQTDRIAKIALDTGRITGWLNLQGLLSSQDYSSPIGILNGIAYDSINGSLFVTGKLWPRVFEIREIPLK